MCAREKKGCLVGCLTNLLLVLGVAALLFVGAHVLGFVKSDPQTGAPTLRFDNLPEIKLGDFDLSKIELPDVSKLTEKLPKWAYGVNPNGLTIKTLRAGDGEAVFVCADGYTMLVGAGSGTGAALCGQLLLCGVNHLSAAIAMGSGGRTARRDENGAGADAAGLSLCAADADEGQGLRADDRRGGKAGGRRSSPRRRTWPLPSGGRA